MSVINGVLLCADVLVLPYSTFCSRSSNITYWWSSAMTCPDGLLKAHIVVKVLQGQENDDAKASS